MDRWEFIVKRQDGGWCMENYEEETSGVGVVLTKPIWQDSCRRQTRVIRYQVWQMNLIRYGGWRDISGKGFSLNWLSKICATARWFRPYKDHWDKHQGQGLEDLQKTEVLSESLCHEMGHSWKAQNISTIHIPSSSDNG